MRNRANHEFWVTNVSNKMDISLSDLRLTIRRGQSKNLLDPRYYKYTLDQLHESAETGSISKKSRYIKVRDLPPTKVIKPGVHMSKQNRQPNVVRTNVEIEIPKYADLDIETLENDIETFAAEEADFADEDNTPILPIEEDT